MLKKSLIAAAVAVSLIAASAPASATVNSLLMNWKLDDSGVPYTPVNVADYVDVVGQALVTNVFTGPSFSFQESGRFAITTADGGIPNSGLNFPTGIIGLFTGTGTGVIGGTLNFNTDGLLTVKKGITGDAADTTIAIFQLDLGIAGLNGCVGGCTIPPGNVHLELKATYMLADYFFDSANVDLAPMVNNTLDNIDLYAIVNMTATEVDGLVTNVKLIDNPAGGGAGFGYNNVFDPDLVAPVADGASILRLTNNGSVRLETRVLPEPSMLSLMGLALVGFGAASRRKSKARA